MRTFEYWHLDSHSLPRTVCNNSRSLDEVLHNQMNDLETERSLFLYGEGGDEFAIDSTVEQLFLDAVPEEDVRKRSGYG